MTKRLIDTELWNNGDIIEKFTAEDKYFWLYLLTNPHNNICGVMKASSVVIARDMGYSKECVQNLLYRFSEVHKAIFIDQQTNELIILNWAKFNWNKSKDILNAVERNLKSIQSQKIIEILKANIVSYLWTEKDSKGNRVLTPCIQGTITNTNTITNNISNSIYNNRDISNNRGVGEEEREEEEEEFAILPIEKVKDLCEKNAPTIFNRHEKDGNGDYRLGQVLDGLQGELTLELIENLLYHANKTYIVQPKYQNCDLVWVLNNWQKVTATEELALSPPNGLAEKSNGTTIKYE